MVDHVQVSQSQAVQSGRAVSPASRPRILFIGPLPPSEHGASIMNANLVRALAERGYAIEAILPLLPAYTPDRRHPGEPDVPLHRVPVRTGAIITAAPDLRVNVLDYIQAMGKALARVADAMRPDIIVSGNEINAAAVVEVAARIRVPCFAIAHTAMDTMICTEVPDTAADVILPALQSVNHVVAVSELTRQRLRARNVERVSVVANTVDEQRYHPRYPKARLRRRLGIADADTVVFHSSNLASYKRVDDILRSAAQTVPGNPRLRYIFAGSFDGEGIPDHLARLARPLGDRARFIDWRPQAAMPFHYAAADMVVMPSETEAASLSFLEALASGCPLLASDIPAAREMIDHGDTGLLFPCGDVAALTDATLSLAGNAELRARIGRNARAWIEAERPFQASIDAYAGLIDGLAGSPRSAADDCGMVG